MEAPGCLINWGLFNGMFLYAQKGTPPGAKLDEEGLRIARASGAINVPEVAVVEKKPKAKPTTDVTSPSMLVSNIATLKRTNACFNCFLVRANLKGVNLQGANLRGANLWESDLSETNLSNAKLQEANLVGSELKGTNLQGANFNNARLYRANFLGATLDQEGAEIARKSGAINIPEATVVEEKSKGIWFAIKENPKCFLWNPKPVPFETVSWDGVCLNGRANGKGKLIWRVKKDTIWEESIFVGEYKDGKMHGQGTGTTANGLKYVGEFKNGEPNGQGTFTFADGGKYVGEFKDGRWNGQGTITSPRGYKYVGEWKNDKRNGQGTYTYADGRIKEGIWKDNKFQYAQKGTPPAKIENQKLRKRITELEKREKSKPKKVAKQKTNPKPSPKSATSGSGFFVSKLGHVITNEHVVSGCSSITVGENAKKQVSVIIIETDKRNDLALLKIFNMKMASEETKSLIRKLGISVVPLATQGLLRSDDVVLGEKVLVAGFPYGELFSNTIKVTGGIVSANKGMGDDRGQFQIDAAVQPGNSGGPIYDENGNIVGVVVAQLNKRNFEKAIGSIPENVNFGIKGSTVRQFLTTSGIPTKWSNRSKVMNTKKLAQIAKNQTVMVMCHQ